MRSAGNFNSEWGYLAPVPSFMRTVRVVLVATAIGATAGAAVVLSLIDRPTTAEHDRTASITAHAIVTSAQAAPAAAAPAPSSRTAALAAPVGVTTAVPATGAATAQAQSPAPGAPQVKPPVAPHTCRATDRDAAAARCDAANGGCAARGVDNNAGSGAEGCDTAAAF